MGKTIDYQTLSEFFNDLSVMIGSASTMEESLAVLSADARDREFSRVLRLMSEDVGNGESFSTAMKNSEVFPAYAETMVDAGMAAGKLDEVTASLSEFYSRRERMRQTVVSAVVRPLILLTLLAMILGAFIAYILPLLTGVYDAIGGDASIYIKSSYIIGGAAFGIVLIMAVLLAILGISFKKRGMNGGAAGRLWEKSFITKNTARTFEQAYFISDVTTRIAGGLMPDRAFASAAESVSNDELRKKLETCAERIAAGESMGTVLLEESVLPTDCTHIIYSMARSGQTEKALEKAGGLLFDMAESEADNLVRRIEPAFTGVFTVAIGISLVSVILPLIGIISSV